jgi:hypothetical protein
MNNVYNKIVTIQSLKILNSIRKQLARHPTGNIKLRDDFLKEKPEQIALI